MAKGTLELLREETTDIEFFTASYIDILETKNPQNICSNIFRVSVSGGNLIKELIKTYGEDPADDIFYKIYLQEKSLAPSWSIYKEYKDSVTLDALKESKYYSRYKSEILDTIDFISVFRNIISLAKKAEKTHIGLYCYEIPREFCHRHIIAEKLSYLTGKKIPEFSTEQTKRVMGRLIF